jgi:hypothetical protein
VTRRALKAARCSRRLSTSAALCALALLCLAATANGQASVGKFVFQSVNTFETATPECMPPDLAGVVGTATLSETTTGHFTETESGFHIEGSTRYSGHVDFPDGRSEAGGFPNQDRFAFNATASGQTTFTLAGQSRRTIYDAEGRVAGTVFIHTLTHITFHDANGNGEPDPGEITASVDRFFFTCG